MEEESWRGNYGGVIIEEAARRRQPGKGSQEEAARRLQETPRSVSLSVSVSVPILLLELNLFKGPRRPHAAGQRLRDPR